MAEEGNATFAPIEPMQIGQRFRSWGPPPLTRCDLFLWNWFGITRERPLECREYVVVAVGTSDVGFQYEGEPFSDGDKE